MSWRAAKASPKSLRLVYFEQMAAITLHIPDHLALQVQSQQDRLPEILELGMRELNAESREGFEGTAEVLEFLAGLPSPFEMLSLRPSKRLAERVQELLEKNRSTGLTSEEEREWQRYEYLEHIVRVAKAAARIRLGIDAVNA
jgi:hypothetical protein